MQEGDMDVSFCLRRIQTATGWCSGGAALLDPTLTSSTWRSSPAHSRMSFLLSSRLRSVRLPELGGCSSLGSEPPPPCVHTTTHGQTMAERMTSRQMPAGDVSFSKGTDKKSHLVRYTSDVTCWGPEGHATGCKRVNKPRKLSAHSQPK